MRLASGSVGSFWETRKVVKTNEQSGVVRCMVRGFVELVDDVVLEVLNKAMMCNAGEVAVYLEKYLDKKLVPGKTYVVRIRHNEFSIKSFDGKIQVTASDLLRVFHYRKVADFITVMAECFGALYREKTVEVCGKQKVLEMIRTVREYAGREAEKHAGETRKKIGEIKKLISNAVEVSELRRILEGIIKDYMHDNKEVVPVSLRDEEIVEKFVEMVERTGDYSVYNKWREYADRITGRGYGDWWYDVERVEVEEA